MERSTRAQLNGIRAPRLQSCWRLPGILANTKLENRFRYSRTQKSSKMFRFSMPELDTSLGRSRLLGAVFLQSLRLGQASKTRAHARTRRSPGFISRTVITGATLL